MENLLFTKAKEMQAKLEGACNATSASLQKYTRNAMGLVTERSSEYLADKKAYDFAFSELRYFNGQFVKSFKKELAAERRAKREARTTVYADMSHLEAEGII